MSPRTEPRRLGFQCLEGTKKQSLISIVDGYRMNRTILTSKDMQTILAGLRSLDSVSGSSCYSRLMEKRQAGSSEFVNGRDSIRIDLSSWYLDSLAPKIETIQSAIEIALGVENYAAVDKAYADVTAAGAEGIMEPTTEPWGQRTCYIADLEGNLIEIGSFIEG